MRFRDREDAGRQLADRIVSEELESPVVLALPRGGVPVAAHVAAALGAPLIAFVARKIGAPGQPEYGIGAIAEGNDEVLVTSAVDDLRIGPERMRSLVADERAEVARRVELYRGGRSLPPLGDHDVVLVDDGLATGVTAEAALRALRRLGPGRLVFAAPVCAPDTAKRLADIADRVVCLATPPGFGAVATWYENFTQTTDDEVLALLASGRTASTGCDARPPKRGVTIEVSGVGGLQGDLIVPDDPVGVVLFAHGSGSSRRSPRNRRVAKALRERGFATMLCDLLTEQEERADAQTGRLRFDIERLAHRLGAVTEWLTKEPSTSGRPLGYFGASTGAAAALVCAAQLAQADKPRHRVNAIVSRGGRPDLAGTALQEVAAPTLLIVGGRDDLVLELNRKAMLELAGPTHLEVVEGATHLFEEPGALDEVSRLAGDWFTRHLHD